MHEAFRKTRPRAPAFYYQAEAANLRWLTVPGGPPIPEIISVQRDALELEYILPGTSSPAAAEDFGRRLAVMHRAGADAFGVGPPDGPPSGWIADLVMPWKPYATFGAMYADLRVRPFVDLGRVRGLFSTAQIEVFEKLCENLQSENEALVGPAEPPARLHGDLWSGNVLWSTDKRVWLVDPAAYAGHRESDLAMLALFGAPFRAQILNAYHEVWPLADGWEERMHLHQLYPLLVHSVLYGGTYVRDAFRAARLANEF